MVGLCKDRVSCFRSRLELGRNCELDKIRSMATEKYNVCSVRSCGHREWVARLFDALNDISKGKKSKCSECGGKSYLELEFDFSRGKYPHQCKVLDAFLPKIDKWTDGKGNKFERSFYPFLVIVQSIDEGYRSVWLPYWHIDKDRRGKLFYKYGQWASFIRERRFASLVSQARAKGYKI